ncbi:MAG: hypothetical protein WCH34_14380 [Bacteroidota bacterium]
MKKLYSFIIGVLLLSANIYAQIPQAINYQGVARDQSGNILSKQNVSLRMSLLSDSASGIVHYEEIHSLTTDTFGLFSLRIGQGSPVIGTFSSLNWGNNSYYLRIEIDIAGGTNFEFLANQPFTSVPYAMYAERSGSGGLPNGTHAGDMLYWNGTSWIAIPVGQKGQILQLNAENLPSWSGTIPVVSTTPSSTITQTTAISGGNVVNDGGVNISARGVCWDTLPNPTIIKSKTNDGAGTGNFVSSITGLAGGVSYYVRAYASNSVGTAYGEEFSFTTNFPNQVLLTTNSAISITSSTAFCGGEILDDGGNLIISRGVCWSIHPNPTTDDSKTIDGNGIGVFESSISGLSVGTKYYVRAYATNSLATFYGNEINFTTLMPSLANIITSEVYSITQTTATCEGHIMDDGGSAITAKGICWSISAHPTINDNFTSNGNGNGMFVASISGLTQSTVYHVRAYATNGLGTAYGNEVSFTTSGPPIVATLPADSITASSAKITGHILFDGDQGLMDETGICWSLSPNPTLTDHVIKYCPHFCSPENFTISITGLNAQTIYHVKAYATDRFGTGYGNEIVFTTGSASLPIITTIAANTITTSSANSGGVVISNGGINLIVRGICWSTHPTPTLADNFTTNGNGTGSFVSGITGLTLDSTYYVRAYATNSLGTSFGNEISFTTTLGIGDNYQGGIVAYLFQPGDPAYVAGQLHGLIAAQQDINPVGAPWGCQGTLILGADGIGLGTGFQNTLDIIAGCLSQGIAARLCHDLALGGYHDWYLPSYEELNKLYLNQDAIGGFTVDAMYWSSTEYYNDPFFAYSIDFSQGEGLDNSNFKDYGFIKVRAVRTF